MSLYVDNITTTAGVPTSSNGYPYQPGQIIEYLAGPCDGQSVTVLSGTYRIPLVTSTQIGNTTYTLVSGSNITYMPPSWATRVIYKFDFAIWWGDAHAIADFKFFIDDIEVVNARHNRSGYYMEYRSTFSWTIPVGGQPNNYTGGQNVWNTPKTLNLTYRDYGTSDDMNLHGTQYWDGATSTQFSMPWLSIIAIA